MSLAAQALDPREPSLWDSPPVSGPLRSQLALTDSCPPPLDNATAMERVHNEEML